MHTFCIIEHAEGNEHSDKKDAVGVKPENWWAAAGCGAVTTVTLYDDKVAYMAAADP